MSCGPAITDYGLVVSVMLVCIALVTVTLIAVRK
jgi:hypothetical protein